ncbi:MAG: hypothetical protein HUJ25_04880 [Crocinitomicaceae bacterium]|nr:hypothetical protein [Crocinitomicaceae bacterium]
MKSILFCIVTLTIIANKPVFALEDLGPIPLEYSIVSDTLDESIPSGKFILEGRVSMFSSDNPLVAVKVGCTSSNTWVRTTKDGLFRVELAATDSVVYFYKKGWNEVVIEDYIFKDRHRVAVQVYMNQVREEYDKQVKRKPVIYLYADKNLKASVRLDPKGTFIFTYPRYEDGWDIEVLKTGGVKIGEKEYPYLFWEAESETKLSFPVVDGKMTGFMVDAGSVVPFLEEKLTLLGFLDKEKADFITYWAPILKKGRFALIHFVVDDDYEDQIASLDITPKPESMRRVFMLCATLDTPNSGLDLEEQELTSFERKGFTVVEWGGSLIE